MNEIVVDLRVFTVPTIRKCSIFIVLRLRIGKREELDCGIVIRTMLETGSVLRTPETTDKKT